MKHLLKHLLILTYLLAPFIGIGQTPTISWWYDVNDASFGQSAADDIDGDGFLEIVFGCYRNDSSIYALNANDGTLLWKYNASPIGGHGCNDVAPVIYDINGDGNKEVIVPGSCNPKTFCFNGSTGEVIWEADTRGSDSPPTIADIDNDDQPEIIHGEFNGYVICLNAEDGSEAWEILVDENSWIQTAPTLVDLNGDGQLDFVVATWNFDYQDSVFAYNGTDQTLLWSYPIHDHIYHGTAVADFDEDGQPELLIGSYNDTLYCINGEDGTTEWKYKGTGGYVGSPASIGDLDNDGNCEIVLTNGYKVTALNNDGSLKWEYIIPDFTSAFRGAVLADVNNDAFLDVVFCTGGGLIIGLDGLDGDLLWSVDLAEHYGDPLFALDHAPLIADFDNDGNIDVFAVGGHAEYPDTHLNFGRAYMISIGPGNGPDWLMFQQDIRRQSSLCKFPFSGVDIPDYRDVKTNQTRVYPNPATESLTLEINTHPSTEKSLKINTINGQLLYSQENFKNNQITITTNHWQNGLYFYQIQHSDGTMESGKFVIAH
jgi:outer membrane protein assembly factor BamB